MTENEIGKPGEVPEERLTVTTSDMIEYVKVHAAEQASHVARERVNFFFAFIGVLVAVISAVGAAVLVEFNGRLQSIAEGAAQTTVETRIGDLSKNLDGRFLVLKQELEAEVRTLAQNQATLPLLVSEASALANRGGYNPDDGDRIIAAMQRIRGPILALEGEERQLAFRRIEEIVDNFYAAGDYYRIYRILELFGDDLIYIDGIHFTLLNSISTSIIIDPQRYADSSLYKKLIGFNFNSSNLALANRVVMARLINDAFVRQMIGEEVQSYYKQMSNETNVDIIDQAMLSFLRNTNQELAPEGRNHSPAAYARYMLLREAVETAVSER